MLFYKWNTEIDGSLQYLDFRWGRGGGGGGGGGGW